MSTEATNRDASATTLAAEVRGDGPTLVLQHGFAQDRRCLGPLAEALRKRRRLVLPDAPGHGGSTVHGSADVSAGAALLVATGGPGVYVGYSMGGRLCLRAALDHGATVGALVLIGATAGIPDEHEREQRRLADHGLADRLERIGVDAFVEEWLELDLFAGLPDWARFHDERRSNTAAGLAASLRAAGTGSMQPMWDRLDELDQPVLCITGARDTRYGELADAMVESIGPSARHEVVPDAGHAAHLEQPGAVIELVSSFLDGLGQAETNSPNASRAP